MYTVRKFKHVEKEQPEVYRYNLGAHIEQHTHGNGTKKNELNYIRKPPFWNCIGRNSFYLFRAAGLTNNYTSELKLTENKKRKMLSIKRYILHILTEPSRYTIS